MNDEEEDKEVKYFVCRNRFQQPITSEVHTFEKERLLYELILRLLF
jgi:hypothetical protein